MLVVSQSTITEIAGFAEGRQVATESKGGLERDFQSPRTEPGRASLDRELDLKPRPLGYESPRGLAGNHL